MLLSFGNGKACDNLPEQRLPAHLRQGEKLCDAPGGGVCLIREAFRLLAPWVRPGFDLVLVARGKTPFVKSTDVGRHLQRQLKAAGLLREDMP